MIIIFLCDIIQHQLTYVSMYVNSENLFMQNFLIVTYKSVFEN